MIVSNNNEAPQIAFENLLSNTLKNLGENAENEPKKYASLLNQKLEGEVLKIMELHARNTIFENSIELISGQKFPDIIAKNYFGVEVKTTKQNHWKSTGNSVLESTRVEGIERIYMLFGKMHKPIEFKYRPYQDCLSNVVVTHSPRYLIDMNLKPGETIFDKINIGYDKLRKLDNPIKPIKNYYRKNLKKGEELWWMDENNGNPVFKIWYELDKKIKRNFRILGFILFPEILSRKQTKFYRFSFWLLTQHNILCSNVRDIYTAGGKVDISIKNKNFKVKKVIYRLSKELKDITLVLNSLDVHLLADYWGMKPNRGNRLKQWVNLIEQETDNVFEEEGILLNDFIAEFS